MIFKWICFIIYGASSEFATPSYFTMTTGREASDTQEMPEALSFKELHNLAAFEDAEHRGKHWYDQASHDSKSARLGPSSSKSESSASSSSSSKSGSADASSFETKEQSLITRKYRSCTACPQDMLKKRTNIGIEWICGGYQRARRTFKSPCMMRYRNCQDGTMFVKLYDHRCKNDTFHGRHWFYIYRV